MHMTTPREKPYRQKEWEDWEWLEDPYTKWRDISGFQTRLMDPGNETGPDPLPPYAPEPPIH
jgi:hypothetical protein